jgi:ferredoxin
VPAQVKVDWDRCVGSGMCLTTAPSVFDLDDDGNMLLLHGDELTPDEVDPVRDAVACCPAEALELVEDR